MRDYFFGVRDEVFATPMKEKSFGDEREIDYLGGYYGDMVYDDFNHTSADAIMPHSI